VTPSEADLDPLEVRAYLADALDGDHAEITDEEWASTELSTRVRKLVSDVKTRCWSIVEMFRIVFEQRVANGEYALSSPTFHDLTLAEYKTVSLFLGPAVVVADFERFIEGEKYNTLSSARPLCLQIFQYIGGDAIQCPKLTDAEDCESKTQEDFGDNPVAQTYLRNMQVRCEQTLTAKMTVAEALAIILDPRTKTSFFDDMTALYGGYWVDLKNNAISQLKMRLSRAMKFDSERQVEARRSSRASSTHPLPSSASASPFFCSPRPPAAPPAAAAAASAAAAAAAAAAAPPKKRMKMGLAHLARPSLLVPAAASAVEAPTPGDAHFERIANRDVEGYLKLARVSEDLIPQGAYEGQYDPVEDWIRGSPAPDAELKPLHDGAGKKMSFLAASAIAYHGGHAAAGRPERLFRDVGFINGALQQRMKPATMSRAAMLRTNKKYRLPAASVVAKYNKNHPNSKRRGSSKAGSADVTAPASEPANDRETINLSNED
jgi:hypothetical protein